MRILFWDVLKKFGVVGGAVLTVSVVFGGAHSLYSDDLSVFGVVGIGGIVLVVIILAAVIWANHDRIKELESDSA